MVSDIYVAKTDSLFLRKLLLYLYFVFFVVGCLCHPRILGLDLLDVQFQWFKVDCRCLSQKKGVRILGIK